MSNKRSVILTSAALLIVILFALFVRMPRYAELNTDRESRMTAADGTLAVYPENRTDKYGLPFFTTMDGYYHVRIGDDLAEKGRFGDPDESYGGELRDVLRHAPDGLSAEYHDGMVRAAVAVWKILGKACPGRSGLHLVFFWFSGLCAALTALFAFILGRRAGNSVGASGNAAGVAAALLVSCSPAFTERTLAGTFDTDMIQLLFTILLMLFMTETLRSGSFLKSLITSVCFGAVAAVFTQFWGAYSFAFALVALVGGMIYVITGFIARLFKGPGRFRWLITRPSLWGTILSGASTIAFATALYGPSYLQGFTGSFRSTATKTSIDNMPHMFVSISEMQTVPFGPSDPVSWIFGGMGSGRMTVVNGIGGVLVLAAAVLCLLAAAAKMISAGPVRTAGKHDSGDGDEGAGICISSAGAYLSVFTAWFLLCWYGTTLGIRFIEHFSAPAGMLAGIALGFLWKNKEGAKELRSEKIMRICIALLISISVVIPSASGAARIYPGTRSLVTDAHEKTMDWIVENSASGDSVIASWWDLGYFYEYASGHPTLWDGGALDPARAIIIGKAFTCDDPELSSALLRMLPVSGNRGIDILREKLGNKEGFAALWELAPLDNSTALGKLKEYGFGREEAEKLEELLHPDKTRETYVVVSTRMLRLAGWMKYFADWDFTGNAQTPVTASSSEGSRVIDHLYSGDGENTGFTKEHEEYDGIEHVVVWRVD